MFASSHMNVVIPSNSDGKGGLFIGDWSAADDIKCLQSRGINHVVSALPAALAYREEYIQHHITQLVVSSEDAPNFDMKPYFEQSLEFIENGLRNGNVLVHCAAGISRSSTLVMVYLMRSRKQGYDECLKFLRSKRQICTPNTGFQKQLREYAKFHGLDK